MLINVVSLTHFQQCPLLIKYFYHMPTVNYSVSRINIPCPLDDCAPYGYCTKYFDKITSLYLLPTITAERSRGLLMNFTPQTLLLYLSSLSSCLGIRRISRPFCCVKETPFNSSENNAILQGFILFLIGFVTSLWSKSS